MSKFVGKFRKDRSYSDDYTSKNDRKRNENAELKKLRMRKYEEEHEYNDEYEDFYEEEYSNQR